MAKRNWSNSEPSVRKPHAAHMAVKRGRRGNSEVLTKVDFALVMASFGDNGDPNRDQPYQPPIVGKSICR